MSKIDKHVPGTVCWVDLMSNNAEAARAFYTSLFGWSFTIGGPESGHYGMAQKDGDQVAGVGTPPPGANMPSVWSVYFASDDLDATLAKVKDNGGNVVMGPMDVMEEGRMGVCADPTGAVFGIWQPKRHAGAKRVNEPGAMCWQEVYTREATKARDFYCKVFGLEPKKLDGMEYYTLHKGPATVAGVMQMNEQMAGVPPHWGTYFAVEDTDAALKRITELGGKQVSPAHDTPYGRIATVSDPTGAMFSIIKLAQP